MSSKTTVLVGLLGAVITFVACAAAGVWLFGFEPWPSVAVGLLISMTTLAALVLAAALGKRQGSSFWTRWTPKRNAAYLIFVAAFQILVGVFCGFTLDRPASTVTLIAGVGGGGIFFVVAVIEYVRLGRREGRGTTG